MGRILWAAAISTWGGTVTTATPTVTAVPAAMPNLACQLRCGREMEGVGARVGCRWRLQGARCTVRGARCAV